MLGLHLFIPSVSFACFADTSSTALPPSDKETTTDHHPCIRLPIASHTMSTAKLSKGALAGIIIGANLTFLLLLVIIFCVRYFRKLDHETQFDRQIAALAPAPRLAPIHTRRPESDQEAQKGEGLIRAVRAPLI